jgi:guanosine-3',5'-bis(diphosphate) 3'-pyrophosphohydrolase
MILGDYMENKIEKAIQLVLKAHEGQKRRNDDIPFSYHPLSVAMNLQAYNNDEDLVVTSLLHDIIEDTIYDYNYIKENFSTLIADNVLLLSEDKEIKDFVTRKQKFLDQIQNISEDLLIIELFDKMHNLTSDYNTYNKIGMKMYERSTSSYENIKWFYLSILEIFENKISDKDLVNKFKTIVNYYFNQ